MSVKPRNSKNFMQHEGVEVGYFSKRKKQFNEAIDAGIKFATGNSKRDNKRSAKKPSTTKKRSEKQSESKDSFTADEKKYLSPGQLKMPAGMRSYLVKQAKGKE